MPLWMVTLVDTALSCLQVQIYELEEHKIETWRGKHCQVLNSSLSGENVM